MNKDKLPIMLGLAFIATFVGLGLGGAFIYGPILLSIGVNPIVSSSTCLYLVVFS